MRVFPPCGPMTLTNQWRLWCPDCGANEYYPNVPAVRSTIQTIADTHVCGEPEGGFDSVGAFTPVGFQDPAISPMHPGYAGR